MSNIDSERIGTLLNFSFRMGIFVLIVLGVFGFILAYSYVDKDIKEYVKYVSFLVIGGATVYSAFYIGLGLRLNSKQTQLKETFQFISFFNDKEQIKYRLEFEKNNTNISFEDNDEISKIRLLLNYIENLSIAIQLNHVNESLIYRSVGPIIINIYKHNLPYIKNVRNQYQSDFQNIYNETEILVKNWEAGNYLYSGNRINS